MEGAVPVALLEQLEVIGGQDAAVGLDHLHQDAGVAGDGDGLHRHAGGGAVRLVEADGLPQLLQAVQVGAAADGFKGVVLQEHPVAHRVQNFLLGLEVVVDCALGQAAQLVHDVLDGGLVVAFFQKEALGRVQNARHRLLGVLVAGHGRASLQTFCWYVFSITERLRAVKACLPPAA